MESSFLGAAFLLAIVAVVLLQRGRRGTGEYIPWGWGTLAIAGLTALGGLLCQNHGLLDPATQNLYRESRFLWWCKRQLVFRKGEIVGVTTDCSCSRRRGIDYRWVYRVVAMGRDGSKEPMGNWERDGLDLCNAHARELAAQLGCASYAAPPEQWPFLEEKDGVATILFDLNPRTKATPTSPVALVAMVAAMILLFLIIATAIN